jgi:hypothetical protein
MSDGTATRRRGLTKTHRRLLGAAGSIAVVVVVFVFVLPQFANYRDVLDVVRTLGWQHWLVLAGAVVLNLATFPPPWMAALPGLGFREALAMTQASTALSIVSPAGAAVGMAASYSMLRSWRFAPGAVALAVAVAGIWNQLVNLAFPVVALALLTGQGQDHPALRTAALIGVAALVVAVTAFALVLSRAAWARRIGDLAARAAGRALRVARRGPVVWGGESFARFRSQALGLLRRRWHVITVATLAGHLTVFVLLLACLRRGGQRHRGVRGLGARPDPRRGAADAGGRRVRRGRPDRRARRVRGAERRGRGGHASLQSAYSLSDSGAGFARCGHLAHAPTGGGYRLLE